MDREELIRQLHSGFGLSANQIDEKGDRGYRLHLSASWPTNWDVRSISVQLTGVNPLSGKDVEKETPTTVLSVRFEKQSTFFAINVSAA